jgi:hypothetical protein
MKHKHHKIPRHAGGTDDPSNIVEVSVSEHAELHFALYLEYGRWQDWLASQSLSGRIKKEQVVRDAVSLQNKNRVWTEEGKAKLAAASRRRAVSVYCPELDKTWDTISDASSEFGTRHESIRRVVRGERKTFRGLTFREVK